MDLKIAIKNLSCGHLKKMRFKCVECNYWFENESNGFLKDLARVKNFNGLKGLVKGKLFEESSRGKRKKKIISFKENGGKIKTAFINEKCIGAILAGKYYLFPRLRDYDVFPPDYDSIFLACIYIIPEYREMGVDKRLLIELEKDLLKEKVKSIESIGKRLTDDMDEEEYYDIPNVPFKFLMNNGFYLIKNDPLFPLLKLDIKSIAVDTTEGKVLLDKVALESKVENPVIIKNE